jgi:chromosome segregation ATPase
MDPELTPRLVTPSEIRTSDSRLIRAKRESDRALAACRRRIEALQNECAHSQKEGKLLEETKEGLEQEARSHQSRIATLERSRAAVEETLASTKSQLDTAVRSEERLTQELEAKSKEIAEWQQKSGEEQRVTEHLQKEKDDLEQRLRTRNMEFRELEIRAATLEETSQVLHDKLATAERHGSLLQERLAETQSACEDLRKRLEQSSQSVNLLEQKVAGHESDATEHLRKIEVSGNVISKLREQLKKSQTANKTTEDAFTATKEEVAFLQQQISGYESDIARYLKKIEVSGNVIEKLREQLTESQTASKNTDEASASLKEKVALLQTNLQNETNARNNLSKALEAIQAEKASTEHELMESQASNKDTHDAFAKSKEEVVRLQAHIRTETDVRADLSKELDAMRIEKAVVEAELGVSQTTNADIEKAVAALKEDVVVLHTQWRTETDARDGLKAELEATRTEKDRIIEALHTTRERLEQEMNTKAKFESGLHSLRSSYKYVQANLRAAHERIHSLETGGTGSRAKLETLLDDKATLEADLREARQVLFRLSEDLRMRNTELADVKRAKSKLEEFLQVSEERAASLDKELEQTQAWRREADEQHLADMHQHDKHLRELEASMLNLRSVLASSEKLEVSLREELQVVQDSKDTIEGELGDALRSKTDLQSQVDHVQSRLAFTECDRDSLQTKVSRLESDLKANSRTQMHHQERLSASEVERSMLKNHVSEIEIALKDCQDAKSKVEEALSIAQTDGEASAAQIANLREQVQDARVAGNEMQGRLDEAFSSRLDLEKQFQSAQDRLAEVEETLSTAQKGRNASDEEIVDLRNQLDEARTIKEEMQKRLDDTVGPKADLEQQLNSAQMRLVQVECEVVDIQSQLLTLHDETAELQRLKEQSDEQLTTLTKSHDELKQELQSTQSQLHAAQTRISKLETRLVSIEEELEAMHRVEAAAERRHEEALKTNADLEKELHFVRESKADFEMRLNSAMSSNAQLEEDLGLTRSTLSKADTNNAKLALQFSNAEEELMNLRQLKDDVDGQLKEAFDSNERLERDLRMSHSYVNKAETKSNELESKLKTAEGELQSLHQLKDDIEKKFSEALAAAASIEEEFSSTNSHLQELDSQNLSVTAELSAANEVLATLREAKTELEQELDSAGKHALSLQQDMSGMRSRMEELESNKASLVSDLSVGSKELAELRATHAELEKLQRATSHRTYELENDLHAAQMGLEIAEAEGLNATNKLFSAEKELTTLRETNAEFGVSEKDLISRLASAEEDLVTVREKNASLEAFLERVQLDLSSAQHVIEKTEQRYQSFVEESQAKLDAAETSKIRYKRRLSERNNELEILINENSDLHHQIGDHKRKLAEELSKKEKYIEELQSSTDKRIRSMNSAYNGLRKEFNEQQHQHQKLDGDHKSAVRLEAELERKTTEMEEMQYNHREFEASFEALEQEVRALREDKKAFEQLIETLQEKIRNLEVLEEWNEPHEPNRTSSPRHITILDGVYDTAPSSPSLSERSMSSMDHDSMQHERPETRASTVSHEDRDSWAKRVEQVRMQRDEAALQLKGMKKSRHNLRKTLRESDAQLHRLEREAKP